MFSCSTSDVSTSLDNTKLSQTVKGQTGGDTQQEDLTEPGERAETRQTRSSAVRAGRSLGAE